MEPTASTNLDLTFRRPTAKKMVQIIPVTITAPNVPGRFNQEYNIWIKDRTEPLKITVTGEVVTRLGSNQ